MMCTLQDLVQLNHYHTLEDTFSTSKEEILEQCQFLEKDTDFSNELERAMSFSRIKNNHIDFKIVERVILGKYLRENFGKDWYKVLDQEDKVDKRRLDVLEVTLRIQSKPIMIGKENRLERPLMLKIILII